MVEITDRRIGGVYTIPPIPPFMSAEEIALDALPLLDPPSAITVTDAAERSIRVPVAGVWQAYDRAVTPYTVEPQDVTQSRRFTAVTFVGPSQSGKSQMLLNVALHAPLHERAPVQVIHMTRRDAEAWSEEKLDPTIRASPDLLARLGRGPTDSTMSRKRFQGMSISVGYPTASQLSSRTQRLVLLTDYDHMPQRLGPADRPEGSPFGMARRRVTTYLTRGCVLAESSPAFPIVKADWRSDPSRPHEFPPVSGGIVAIYNEGTRGRWHWECPDCAALFEPRFERLVYDRKAEPGAAGAGAEMQCPDCGSLIAHRHKIELNRRALADRGGWLHEARDGTLCRIGDAELRDTLIASYALNGVAASFTTWADLVASYEVARRTAEALDDDTDLAQVHYTQLGVPYLPRRLSDQGDQTVESLRETASAFAQGVCPAWTRFVTVSVDVQKGRFPVLVMAWGPQGERSIVDRFDLAEVPDHAPRAGARALDPATYLEDWSVLLDLAARVWPVAGAGYGLRAAAVAVDFQGEAGVSDRATAFWIARRREGEARRWFLTRGVGGFRTPARVWYDAPERGSKGAKARSIKLLSMAVDRLKDSVSAAISRTEDGPGRQHVPGWLPGDHLGELVAEHRTKSGWEKRPGKTRNETFDLSVQALALAEHFGAQRIDWTAPPPWAVSGAGNAFAVPLDLPPGDDDPDPASPDPAPNPKPTPAAKRPAVISYLRRG